MTGMTLPYLDAAALATALPMIAAIDALEQALLAGLDPGADPARMSISSDAGQLLVMPSAAAAQLAVKLVTVAPGNAGLGRPRVQGIVVLFDSVTLAPLALIDGIALTALRTPAVSALAVRHLAGAGARRLVVFGTGPQAEGHVTAIRAVRPLGELVVVGRDVARAEALAQRQASTGLSARTGTSTDVAGADLVVCATTAREPLFDGRLIGDGCCVVAVGSHEPTAREVDAPLVHRSRVVVEDVATALREAGDLVLAGARPQALETLADLVRRGPTSNPPPDSTSGPAPDSQPSLVKTVGMAWEDAVVAAAALAGWAGRTDPGGTP
jgi:ornithine cyclodeaminase/alanine dehydrogenase-like protein (mu-crystallin family)